MKKLIFLTLLLFTLASSYSQRRTYGQKQCIKEKSINLKTTQILFVIEGLIEIDGHTFLNDTCENPIIFKSTIEGVEIKKLRPHEINYTHRKCDKSGCNIIHLQEIKESEFDFNNVYPFNYGGKVYLN